MQSYNQSTIRNVVTCQGVGLHSGSMIQMRLRPAPKDFGVVFRRVDCTPPVDIPAHFSYISDTMLSTTLAHRGHKVSTVEHFLSAVVGFGVDNLLVEIDGPELPIMDGSAAPFVFLLSASGLVDQNAPRKVLVVHEPVHVSEGAAHCSLLPYSGFKVGFKIDFSHPGIQKTRQFAEYEGGKDRYGCEVARARTFGFMSQVSSLKKKNLIRGASIDNAVVLGEDGVLNAQGLRSDDEFVKHKILDAIGDLALVGLRIRGAFEGVCSGHHMNKLLIDKIMSGTGFEVLQEVA